MMTFLILLLFAVIFLVAGIALLYFRNKMAQRSRPWTSSPRQPSPARWSSARTG